MPRAISSLAERRPLFLIPFFFHSLFYCHHYHLIDSSTSFFPHLFSAIAMFLSHQSPLFALTSLPLGTFFVSSHLVSTIIPLRTSLISPTAPLTFPSSTVLLHSFTMLHYGSEKYDAGTFSSSTSHTSSGVSVWAGSALNERSRACEQSRWCRANE